MPSVESGLPPYEQIARHIVDEVRSGSLAPGDRVPSERELREDWQVSKATVNKAIAALKAEGWIETRVGSGTIVADRKSHGPSSTPRDHVQRVSATEPIYRTGERSEIYEAGVISTGTVSPAILNAVGLPTPEMGETSTIVKRARLMLQDDQPRGVCTTWFNYPYIAPYPGGEELITRLTSTSERFPRGTRAAVLDLIEREHTHTVDRVGIRGAPTGVARALKIEPGREMLWILSTRFADDFPVEADEWFRFADDDVTYRY